MTFAVVHVQSISVKRSYPWIDIPSYYYRVGEFACSQHPSTFSEGVYGNKGKYGELDAYNVRIRVTSFRDWRGQKMEKWREDGRIEDRGGWHDHK